MFVIRLSSGISDGLHVGHNHLGAGIDSNTVVAAIEAIVSAVKRLPSMSAPTEEQ